jgi:hypothetical protein
VNHIEKIREDIQKKFDAGTFTWSDSECSLRSLRKLCEPCDTFSCNARKAMNRKGRKEMTSTQTAYISNAKGIKPDRLLGSRLIAICGL